MKEPRWLSLGEVIWLHQLQLREFGGSTGIRDIGLLESALMRVRHRFFYGELTTIPELAVGYATAVSANHPFVDGNKRVSFHCLLVFLRLHGFALTAEPEEATEMMLSLAAKKLDEAELLNWVLKCMVIVGRRGR